MSLTEQSLINFRLYPSITEFNYKLDSNKRKKENIVYRHCARC
jgi:hypothetical protein